MNKEELVQLLKIFENRLLDILGIDDRRFYQLTILQRERYVKLFKELSDSILKIMER